jgi:hypothetical protein
VSRKVLIISGVAIVLLLGAVIYAISAPSPPSPPLETAWHSNRLVTHAQAQKEYEAEKQKTEEDAAKETREGEANELQEKKEGTYCVHHHEGTGPGEHPFLRICGGTE